MADEVTTVFKRGAIPSPKHKLLSATPFRPAVRAPALFAVVPPQLSYWYNQTYGICVSAEDAFAKAAYALMAGLPELFVPDEEVLRWATKYGFRDGATLTDVMDEMQKDGFSVGGVNYKDGPYLGVDYSNEAVLQAAIATGPVKIGIDANALPTGAGNSNGWFATGSGNYPNEDHCVALCGYGPSSYLYQQLGIAPPLALSGKSGYLLFTWDTIGFVDHAWLMGTCQEAWLRNPTTTGYAPTPGPGPAPTPTPVPPPIQQFVKIPDLQVVFTGFRHAYVPGGTYPVVAGSEPEAINWKALLAAFCALAPLLPIPAPYKQMILSACNFINPPGPTPRGFPCPGCE